MSDGAYFAKADDAKDLRRIYSPVRMSWYMQVRLDSIPCLITAEDNMRFEVSGYNGDRVDGAGSF